MPSSVEKILRVIYKYFSKSPKRAAKWLSFQSLLEIKELKINKYIESRWLSEEDCVSRMLQRWDALIDFFKKENNNNKKEILNIWQKYTFNF